MRIMSQAEPTSVAIALLKERDRDALVERLTATLADLALDEAVAFLADLLLAAGADRDRLKERVVSLLASRFGRRSEKSSDDQLQLFAQALIREPGKDAVEGEQTDDATTSSEQGKTAAELIEQTNNEIESEKEAQRRARKKAAEARRQAARLEGKDGDSVPWPTHLPVREETLPLPEELRCCADCGEERKVIRYDKSWRLEHHTTSEVVVTRTPVAACKSHHGGPVSVPVPPKPVDKGQLGFSLASHILWLRITHNLPVRRIAEMLQAEGAPVSERVIHTLIGETGQRARPVVEAIAARVRQAELVNIDDTFTDVYEEGDDNGSGRHRKRVRRRARVWVALGDERYAYFFATRSWKAEEAVAALGEISGVLQGDGYGGFPGYAAEHDVTLAGCMSHLRRKMQAAVKAKDPRASLPMGLINGMYSVEKLARLRRLSPDERLALRQERSVPMMAKLLDWADDVAPTIVKGSPLGKAWTYLDNQQEMLQVFLHHGAVSIDNNAAERALRRHTVGRKLWLFFRDQDKLEHVARLMAILTTARLHGVEEKAYLTWLLEQLARREWSDKAADALLPDAWMAMNEKQAEDLGG